MAQDCLLPPSISSPRLGPAGGCAVDSVHPLPARAEQCVDTNPLSMCKPSACLATRGSACPLRIRVQCCHGWAREGSAPVRGTPNRLGWTYGARAYDTQPVTSRPRMALCAVPHVIRGRQILTASRSGTFAGAFIRALCNVASSSSGGRICRGSPMPVLKPLGGMAGPR